MAASFLGIGVWIFAKEVELAKEFLEFHIQKENALKHLISSKGYNQPVLMQHALLPPINDAVGFSRDRGSGCNGGGFAMGAKGRDCPDGSCAGALRSRHFASPDLSSDRDLPGGRQQAMVPRPEVPGLPPADGNGYKDDDGQIKKQVQRFRVYGLRYVFHHHTAPSR